MTSMSSLTEAFDNLLTEVARSVAPSAAPGVWDAINKLEEIVYPENFADPEDADDEEEYEQDYAMCECEIDWHCGCGNHPMVRDDARLMASRPDTPYTERHLTPEPF